MTVSGLTFDTGVLIALERRARRAWNIYRAARDAKVPITVPAAVVAEWWRGRTDAREHVRSGVVVEWLSDTLAEIAGEALLPRHRKMRIWIERVVDRYAGFDAKSAIGLDDGPAATIGQHRIEPRQIVTQYAEVGAVELGQRRGRVDVPEEPYGVAAGTVEDALDKFVIENADAARLDDDVGVSCTRKCLVQPAFGRGVDHDPRPFRLVHIAAIFASGALFLVRGILLFADLPGAKAIPVQIVSYTIDTTLLTAALMLMTIVQQYPFADAWLTVKVLLLIVYIVLGVIAFWTNVTRPMRLAAWAGALAVYAYIYTVARAHDPMGIFAGLAS